MPLYSLQATYSPPAVFTSYLYPVTYKAVYAKYLEFTSMQSNYVRKRFGKEDLLEAFVHQAAAVNSDPDGCW